MRNALRLFLLLGLVATSAIAADEAPAYLGHWSNGRGETLVITAKTLRFGDDKPVPYRDVTRATDGENFELQITAQGEVNGFSGKTLALVLEEGSMHMIGYRSHADYMEEKNPQQDVTWEKDSGADD